MARDPEDYLDLPYHITLVKDRWEDGEEGWFAEVEELRGCMSQGRTPEEAIDRVRDAMLGWISVALEDGSEIPEPRTERRYSGRLLLRLPKSLHAEVARAAQREGVSINQLLVTLIAAGLKVPA
jgi:antitoxin HicB